MFEGDLISMHLFIYSAVSHVLEILEKQKESQLTKTMMSEEKMLWVEITVTEHS